MSTAAPSVFRFAPSPNGRLHLGHGYCALLNAALAARTRARLLLRIEDIDPARSRPDLAEAIRLDLAWLGLRFEEPVRWQSEHLSAYRAALDRLIARGLAYPCFCTRGDIRAATAGRPPSLDPDGSPLYPGTCRALRPDIASARRAACEPHAWRLDTARALALAPDPHAFRAFDPLEPRSPGCRDAVFPSVPEGAEHSSPSVWLDDPRLALPGRDRDPPEATAFGERVVAADPSRWGDPVIARRDVPASYHLAVVTDDAAQGITHVVRGRDLEAATDLHVLLQVLLGLPTPRYHHHALILDADGGKLAKSKDSEALADWRTRGATPASIRERLGFR